MNEDDDDGRPPCAQRILPPLRDLIAFLGTTLAFEGAIYPLFGARVLLRPK